MTRGRFLAAAVAILLCAAAFRFVWLTADGPTTNGVGIVSHDEGPWVHSARNKALWGVWRTDDWNPVFIAPVFTDRKSTRLNSSHVSESRMPSSA